MDKERPGIYRNGERGTETPQKCEYKNIYGAITQGMHKNKAYKRNEEYYRNREY